MDAGADSGDAAPAPGVCAANVDCRAACSGASGTNLCCRPGGDPAPELRTCVSTPSSCNGDGWCCPGASDCGGGAACCADTTTFVIGTTTIACRAGSACVEALCTQPGTVGECPGGATCTSVGFGEFAETYSFYFCNS